MKRKKKPMSLEYQVISIAKGVYDELGSGWPEHIYQGAMEVGLRKLNLAYEAQRPITVEYLGHAIGTALLDLVVGQELVVELKAVNDIGGKEITQLNKYLQCSGLTMGLLINFPQPTGKKPSQEDIGLVKIAKAGDGLFEMRQGLEVIG